MYNKRSVHKNWNSPAKKFHEEIKTVSERKDNVPEGTLEKFSDAYFATENFSPDMGPVVQRRNFK